MRRSSTGSGSSVKRDVVVVSRSSHVGKRGLVTASDSPRQLAESAPR